VKPRITASLGMGKPLFQDFNEVRRFSHKIPHLKNKKYIESCGSDAYIATKGAAVKNLNIECMKN
jgi:hypothetical protein